MIHSALALYLTEIGHCERKIQYCKEVMAEDMNFIPEMIFNLCTNHEKTIGTVQIEKLLETFHISVTQEEISIILKYFSKYQLDFLTLKSFTAAILPYYSPALTKAINKRIITDFQVTTNLKFRFKKFVEQILINHAILDSFDPAKFEIFLQKQQGLSLLTKEHLQTYLKLNGCYLTPNELCSILRQLSNKHFYRIDSTKFGIYIDSFIQNPVSRCEQSEKQSIKVSKSQLSNRRPQFKPDNLSSPLKIKNGQAYGAESQNFEMGSPILAFNHRNSQHSSQREQLQNYQNSQQYALKQHYQPPKERLDERQLSELLDYNKKLEKELEQEKRSNLERISILKAQLR